MKKAIAIGLCLILLLTVGCSSAPVQTDAQETTSITTAATEPMTTEQVSEKTEQLEENIIDDKCRNWYEIFVYSFADSDGDGIGDFNGISQKLDYIKDLGFNGIWLMPIMPSPSYHKYDVTDYYSVDSQYGTIEDFENLLNLAHEKDIRIIIDLVINHTSSQNPWFVDAKTGEDSKYRDWYNWSEEAKSGYSYCNSGWYEAQFVDSMPDLNLDNEDVRSEISNIVRFWLNKGVDGFRLDAVKYLYISQTGKNIEFLDWLTDECRAVNEECYLVGEAWTDEVSLAEYYQSKIDSFFYFPGAQYSGTLIKIAKGNIKNGSTKYGEYTINIEKVFGEDALMAPFLSNHDTGRVTSATGSKNLVPAKTAWGMLAMQRGGIYLYYGEEIGMSGSGDDPNKRISMYWSEDVPFTKDPPGVTQKNYKLPSQEEQEADPGSIYNYIKLAMQIRNAYPEIARGTTELLTTDNDNVCLLKRTYEERTVYIALNLCDNEESVSVEATVLNAVLDPDFENGNGVRFENQKLTMDPWSIAVLH